jgi:hypothetical protein
MKQNWFKSIGVYLLALCGGLVMLPQAKQVEAYQDAPTPGGIVITVTYTDPMNVRNGPGTFYDIIGQIFPGDVFPALGISPGREWIQISYQGGIGWVYAPYVAVSGGELTVVEAPPTPTPLVTNTVDPTLAAQFHLSPTVTRLPTFTPPAPMTEPAFGEDTLPDAGGVPSGYFIIILGVLGLLGLAVSFISQR